MPSRFFNFVWFILPAVALLESFDSVRAEESPLRSRIDGEVRAAWQREKISPANPSNDAEFLRRVFIDLLGVVPSYEETQKFLADSSSKKRSELIDRLLDDPRFAKQQAQVWDLVLFGRKPSGDEATRKRDGFRKWLETKFAKNVPFDQLAKQLLLAEEEGPEVYYVQYRNNPEEATVAVSRVFLGTQLQCARCHDHPFENWTQRDFYGMAGFFVRLVVLDAGSKKYKIGEKSTGEVLFTGAVKDQKPGQKGEPIKPRFLGGEELKEPPLPKNFKEDTKGKKDLPKPPFSRKEQIANWITAKNNPYFARALANRVWAQFMGRGFVQPVDDLGSINSPSHPDLLDAIAKSLVASNFDLKMLIREIVNSNAYQLAATGPVRDALPQWYERARVRPMTAEELTASFKIATNTPSDAKVSGDTSEYMLRYFGEPTDGLGQFQGSVSEHLYLNNAAQLRTLCQQKKGNLADTLITSKGSWEEKVDRLYLTVLSRPPSTAERQRFVQHLSSGDAKMTPTLVEEAIWVLLTCAEYRFNH